MSAKQRKQNRRKRTIWEMCRASSQMAVAASLMAENAHLWENDNTIIMAHSNELRGASKIVDEWIENMEAK